MGNEQQAQKNDERREWVVPAVKRIVAGAAEGTFEAVANDGMEGWDNTS